MYRSNILLAAVLFIVLLKFAETMSATMGGVSGKLELLVILLLAGVSLLARSIPRPLVLLCAAIVFALSFGLRSAFNPYGIGQLLIDLKLPLAIVAAYGFVTHRLVAARLGPWFFLLLGVSLIFVAVMHAQPGLYQAIFSQASISTTVAGTSYRRAVGIFVHPAPFGIFSSLALIYFLARGSVHGWSRRDKLGMLLAALCLLASGQRLEALSVLAMALALYTLLFAQRPLVLMTLLLAGFLTLVVAGSGIVQIYQTAQTNFDSSTDPNDMIPRALLLNGAVRLANADFPFGAGLGTYASSMSQSNPTTAYARSGITAVWWYGKRSFLTDTYWAKALGETGWIGAAILLAVYLAMLVGPALDVRAADPALAFGARLSFLGLGFMLLDSIAAPIYTGSALPILLTATFFAYYLKAKQTPTSPELPAGAAAVGGLRGGNQTV
jgi:hypothetical protein